MIDYANRTSELDPDLAARALLRALRSAGEPPRLLLNSREAAQALGVSEKHLWANTAPRGLCIPSLRAGERSIRYSVRALEKWIEEQPIAAASEAESNGTRVSA